MSTEQDPEAAPTAMTSHDWFTLFLRAVGIWELLNTCDEAVTILNINAGIWKPQHTEIGSYVSHALVTFLIGIWLLKGAPTIARVFYPLKPSGSKPSQDTAGLEDDRRS